MGRFSKKRLTAEEREAIKLRRHEHRRQIKGSYCHSERFHGEFFHPGDPLLERFLPLLAPGSAILAACGQRHVRRIEAAGHRAVWHVERPVDLNDVLLGRLPRRPEAQGPLARLRFNAPLGGAFVCERLQQQANLHDYLVALRCSVAYDAPVALVVPNAHHELVDDHLNLFTAGTLVYNLVRAGWNCREATVDFDKRHLNVLLRRVDVPEPWPQRVDDIRPFAPFKNVFQYCSSEFPEVYR